MYRIVLILICCLLVSCENDYNSRVAKNDISLDVPKPGDWLYEHKESAQSLNNFIHFRSLHSSDTQHTIYIQPLGEFNRIDQVLLSNCIDYLTVFFQLKIESLPEISETIVPKDFRRLGSSGTEQLNASYIIDSLLGGFGYKHQLALMALSNKDLYPKEEWNYVFGFASYEKRIGITSFFRFSPANEDDSLFSSRLRLLRLLKTASHEIGHMLGMSHCVYAQCVMNGSNTLGELDKISLRLCSKCQQKLYYAIRYDQEKRLNELIRFLNGKGLKQEAALLSRDLP